MPLAAGPLVLVLRGVLVGMRATCARDGPKLGAIGLGAARLGAARLGAAGLGAAGRLTVRRRRGSVSLLALPTRHERTGGLVRYVRNAAFAVHVVRLVHMILPLFRAGQRAQQSVHVIAGHSEGAYAQRGPPQRQHHDPVMSDLPMPRDA